MQPIRFPEVTVLIAKNQPRYLALPAYQFEDDPEGLTVFCWSLTWAERIKLFYSGILWHQVLTFRKPLQPQLLQVDKPKMPPHSL